MKSTRDALSFAEEVILLFESELHKPQSDGDQRQGASDNPSGNTIQLSSTAQATIEIDAFNRILNASTSAFLPDFGTMVSQELQEICARTNSHDARTIRVSVVEPSTTGTAVFFF